MQLNVYYKGVHIGKLETTKERGIVFSYTELAQAPISISLRDISRTYAEKECLPFFEGLLPEGEIRRQIAFFAHVSASSTMKLLEEFGADIAGALVISREPLEIADNGYRELTETEIEQRISRKSRIPLLYSGKGIRLSLAGAENKIPVLCKDGKYFLPEGNAASTHIIKATDEFVENEYICNRLAFHCGLEVPEMTVSTFGEKTALVIRRYDRDVTDKGTTRLHQEDFCQALGIMPRNKYEENGGPGMKAAIRLIAENSSSPASDIRKFLKGSAFNFVIGNCDAHAKNFSFLYSEDLKEMHLAPFYDLVCSSIYEQFDKSLAMKIGAHRSLEQIARSDFYDIVSRKLADDVLDELVSIFPVAVQKTREEQDDGRQNIIDAIVKDSIPRLDRMMSPLKA